MLNYKTLKSCPSVPFGLIFLQLKTQFLNNGGHKIAAVIEEYKYGVFLLLFLSLPNCCKYLFLGIGMRVSLASLLSRDIKSS